MTLILLNSLVLIIRHDAPGRWKTSFVPIYYKTAESIKHPCTCLLHCLILCVSAIGSDALSFFSSCLQETIIHAVACLSFSACTRHCFCCILTNAFSKNLFSAVSALGPSHLYRHGICSMNVSKIVGTWDRAVSSFWGRRVTPSSSSKCFVVRQFSGSLCMTVDNPHFLQY